MYSIIEVLDRECRFFQIICPQGFRVAVKPNKREAESLCRFLNGGV